MIETLLAMKGLIETDEGRRLAKMAAQVPASQAIVELGSHRGLSSCWLIHGSRAGHRAHVTCIDPWPLYGSGIADADKPWAEEGALEQWQQNVDLVSGWPLVTPLRSTAVAVAATWAKPVGLLFHDADHLYESVKDDYLAWLPYLVPGAWVAVHDFYGSECVDGQWVRNGSEQRAVRDVILTSGEWSGVEIIGNLWVGRRG